MKTKTAKKPKAIESIKDLTPDIGNVNRGTERGNFQLDWSLSEFGAWRSIAASADGVIAAGNQTLQQAADHGLKIRPVHTSGDELVVVIRDDISSDDPRFRQYAIADNRISELNYLPDVEMLLTHQASGVDISPMYREDEIELLKASLTPEMKEAGAGGDDFDTTPEDTQTRVQYGDLWGCGEHRVLCGDSTKAADVARVMAGEKANAVLTDPPYGINQDGVTNDEPEKLEELVKGSIKHLPIEQGVVVAFQSTRTFPLWLDEIRRAEFHFERMLWLYKEAQCTFPWRGWILT